MKKAVVMEMLVVMALSIVLNFMSCKKDEPVQPHITSIQLSVEDMSCTEAWLKVSLSDASDPRTVAIQQDGQRVLTVQMLNADSLCVIEGLFPRHTYTFVAQRVRDTTAIDASSPVQATTMDTTSHDFHFEVDTLGIASSTLYDVAIINDTLAYAVGEIFLNDSTGQLDPIAYSIAEWNGSTWQMKRLFYNGDIPIAPIRGVFALTSGNVWLTAGSVFHWNGVGAQAELRFSRLNLPDPQATIEKVWGSSQEQLVCVGYAGTIVEHGSAWQRLESGTSLPVSDVFGAYDRTTNSKEVLALASNANSPTGSKVLSIENGVVRELPSLGLSWGLDAIWFIPGREYVIVGDGLWRTHNKESSWVKDPTLALLHKTCIDGTGFNDIVVGGAFWYLIHYNGVSWRRYFPFTSGSFTAVAMRNNLIMAVGGIGDRAIVARGTR